MRFIADLHIHSKYSRATSKEMVLEEIDRVAGEKGIKVMGTGDFTHPRWMEEIKGKLEPAEPGLFKLKKQFKKEGLRELSDTRFILSVEISSIYSRGGKVRRIHNIVFVPSIESAEASNNQLTSMGCNLKSDGRPIIGLDSEKLAETIFNIDSEAMLIPAHAWTPWFSVFGSMSGFDSIEECFGKYADRIFAIETGLSSDPQMNWKWSALDKIALISNSDAHSLPKIGREANIFDAELSYKGIVEAIKSGIPLDRQPATHNQQQKFVATLEFFPEEGKYHYDGHRACGISLSPKETKKYKGICPKCGKKLTIGVYNRVEVLADRDVQVQNKANFRALDNYVPFYNLISLDTIIAESLGVRSASKKVKAEYEKIIKNIGPELEILLNAEESDLNDAGVNPRIIDGIRKMRQGNVKIKPGYDGEYGIIKLF